MKNNPTLFHFSTLLLLLLLAACSGKRQQMELLLNEQLAKDHYQLLVDNDSLGLRIVEYFSIHGNRQQQMQAYYTLGRSYDAMGENMLALQCYSEAIALADTTRSDCDYGTLSRTNAHIAKLFNYYFGHLPRHALHYARQALHYATVINDTTMQRNSRQQLAYAYMLLGKTDSMDLYNPQLKEDFYAANHLFFTNDSHRYNDHFTKPLGISDTLFWMNTPNLGKKTRETTFDLDVSALPPEIYLVESHGFTIIDENSYSWEHPINASMQNYIKSQADTAKTIRTGHLMAVLLCMLLLLLGILSYFIIQRQHVKARESLKTLNTRYSLALARSYELQAEIDQLQNQHQDKDKILEEKQEQLAELERQLADFEQGTSTKNKRSAINYLRHPHLTELHQKAATGLTASDGDMNIVLALAQQTIPKFIQALKQLDADLDDSAILFCVLVKFHFVTSELAILFNKSEQTTSNRKVRLLRRLFHLKGRAKQFDAKMHLLGEDT